LTGMLSIVLTLENSEHSALITATLDPTAKPWRQFYGIKEMFNFDLKTYVD